MVSPARRNTELSRMWPTAADGPRSCNSCNPIPINSWRVSSARFRVMTVHPSSGRAGPEPEEVIYFRPNGLPRGAAPEKDGEYRDLPGKHWKAIAMKSWIIRSLAAVVLSLVTAVGLVAPASATPRATLKAAASAVAFEQVGGSNYPRYKAAYPSQLNWTNDGCSVPNKVLVAGGLGVVLKVYGKVFEHSCDRHDFGYRNFGSATNTSGTHPKFSPTRTTKNQIDSRFYANMKIQCDDKFGGVIKAPLRAACKGAAGTFYQAVSHFADDAFFA